MTTFKIRTTLGTETSVTAETIMAAIVKYCTEWDRNERTIRSIERM